ncbi:MULTISPECIES: hypothetical protein [Xanthomonas]|uniref:hypothetical protein n=1 Tax=Xanthomonas TaxID=338 RepID=UPI0011B21080|nr:MULTISPECIES: hypothetical protein [Xanthomonas]QXF03577.1 hypothetical protein KJA71_09030 [Xanthomonas citri pv. citri]QXO96831.1 hypothetical protein IG630_24080 [Xanthomonas sp. WG16]
MSWGAKHPSVLKSLHMRPDGQKGKELTDAESARSLADTARCVRQAVSTRRAATVSFAQRDRLAVRIKHLDAQIAYWDAIADGLEAQGGGQ